ncbi:hypothetical protein DDD63_09920 [Actinobaculum sp. 313]|nr:hypothetical protein DDD63_09920 [Actinobaculum sp. 313]
MAVFALENGRLVPAHPVDASGSAVVKEALAAIRERALDLIEAPLFPVAWTSEPDVGSIRESLIALDPTGQIVTVEVLERLSADELMGALVRAGRHADLSSSRLASLYAPGAKKFPRDWKSFIDSCPPHPASGPRLFLIVLGVAEGVRPAIDALASGDVEVHIASLHHAGARVLVSLDKVRPQITSLSTVLGAAAGSGGSLISRQSAASAASAVSALSALSAASTASAPSATSAGSVASPTSAATPSSAASPAAAASRDEQPGAAEVAARRRRAELRANSHASAAREERRGVDTSSELDTAGNGDQVVQAGAMPMPTSPVWAGGSGAPSQGAAASAVTAASANSAVGGETFELAEQTPRRRRRHSHRLRNLIRGNGDDESTTVLSPAASGSEAAEVGQSPSSTVQMSNATSNRVGRKAGAHAADRIAVPLARQESADVAVIAGAVQAVPTPQSAQLRQEATRVKDDSPATPIDASTVALPPTHDDSSVAATLQYPSGPGAVPTRFGSQEERPWGSESARRELHAPASVAPATSVEIPLVAPPPSRKRPEPMQENAKPDALVQETAGASPAGPPPVTPSPIQSRRRSIPMTVYEQSLRDQAESRRRAEQRLWENSAPKHETSWKPSSISESSAAEVSSNAVERAAEEDAFSPAGRLLAVARRNHAPFAVTWTDQRRGVTVNARVTPWGTIVLAGGETYTDPTLAARAVSGDVNINGWRVWKIPDGRSLGEI